MAAAERHGVAQAPGAGLLASAAYDHGRFDLAQKLSALEDTPMSAWVRAKLDLRRGDRETALNAYERALKAFPASGSTLVQVETAVLRVSRGDYIQALDLFYRAAAKDKTLTGDYYGFDDYWGDAAYLAERVLTIEELHAYVDGNLPPALHAGSSNNSERSPLRNLLARRLMRAGRRREALSYFDNAKLRATAERYDNALSKGAAWWRSKWTRAEGWFVAGSLARSSGMELLGFEREPDYAMWDGNYAPFASPPIHKRRQPKRKKRQTRINPKTNKSASPHPRRNGMCDFNTG